VYIPFASIVPTVAFPPAIEFTDHVTVLLAGLSLEVSLLVGRWRLASLLVVRPFVAPLLVVPLLLAPLLVAVLLVALLPNALVVDALLAVALFTVAANASCDPARTVAVAGVTVTLALLLPSGGRGEPSLPVFVPRPEQPLSHNMRSTACAPQIRFTDMPPK
jgi:hypothetical protein